MTTQITEVLMGLGSFDIAFKHDAELVDVLPLYDHVHVYQGERRIYTGVILRRQPAPGAQIGGAGIDWWLGQDSDGPLIVDREYIAGTNKLSNGGFEDQELLWRVDEDTKWVFRDDLPAYAGDWVAAIADGPTTQDDVLQSNESFEAAAGNFFYAEAYVNRGTPSPGRIRLRIVFSGRFRHPNIVDNAGIWNDSSHTVGDASDDGSGVLRLGPTTQRQSISNDSFEADLAHWYDQDGPAYAIVTALDIGIYQAAKAVKLDAFGAGGRVLLYDDDPATAAPAVEPISVAPGERIFLQFAVTPWAAAGAATHADGRVYAGVLLTDIADANPVFFQTDQLDIDSVGTPAWTLVSTEFTVPEDRVRAIPFIQAYDVTVGTWAFDAVTFTHQERNEAVIDSPLVVTQTPERTYRLTAPVTSDAGVDGRLKARVRFSATGRDDVIVESSGMDPTDGEEKLLIFDYEPPSGYTTAVVSFVGTDITGGSFRVRKSGITLIDNDPSTKVPAEAFSATSTSGWELLFLAIPSAPAGAERCHAEVVAEADTVAGDSWAVDNVALLRIPGIDGPATAAGIVDELLADPDDLGVYLVPAGTIHDAGYIAYDWRIRNMTNRDALKHLSRSGLTGAAREWKVNPDPSIDWGLAEEIFADRTDIVLQENDLILRGKPAVKVDASTRVTDVKVIGADRTPVGGVKQLITGEAAVDPGDAADWFGNPLRRSRVVEDSTVDTRDYATGRAELELGRNGTPTDANRFALSDWRAAGRFDVGDTVYAYVPDAGLVDETNEVDWGGRTIWPVGKRVLDRTWRLGSGQFRVEIRAADGTTRDVTDFVEWENETSADIRLGDALPEFAVDPQGGAAGAQFRRYRGSTGR